MQTEVVMATFLLAPLMTLFSKRLYRKALHSGVGRGFGYLLYLTVLFCVLTFVLCQLRLLPLTSQFIDWLVQVTPEMTLTQTGLNVDVAQPYLVEHPAIGPLYLIDTTKSASDLLADQSPAVILIGKNAVVARQPQRNQVRVFNLDQAMEQVRQANRPLQITKQVMNQLSKRLLGMLVPIVLVFLAPLFFIWKLLAALFYSLLALLLNLFRKEKLRYSALFNVACYAITPVTVIQAVGISFPELPIRLNFFLAIALSVAYLCFGIFLASRSQTQV